MKSFFRIIITIVVFFITAYLLLWFGFVISCDSVIMPSFSKATLNCETNLLWLFAALLISVLVYIIYPKIFTRR